MAPTPAVLGVDGIPVEARRAPLAVGPRRVAPAVQTLASDVVAFVEDQVGIRVSVAVALLTRVADLHRVPIVTWGTSTEVGISVYLLAYSAQSTRPNSSSCTFQTLAT